MARPRDALTIREISRLFSLNEEAVRALMASGDLLGRSASDEVPIEQLEAFFRRNLERAVQLRSRAETEADRGGGGDAVEPGTKRRRKPVRPVAAPAPEPDRSDPEIERPASVPRKIEAMTEDPSNQSSDFRRTPRYTPPSSLEGTFGELGFTIMEISTSGLRIRHPRPLDAGKEGKLSFTLADPPQTINLRGRVVWTTAATFAAETGEPSHVSGIRVIDAGNRLENLIKSLSTASADEPAPVG